MNRAQREQRAYDEEGVFESSHGWHVRFRHVFECPNTRAHEQLFDEIVRGAAAGGRVLELGCADGASALEILKLGARSVRGVDISEKLVARARVLELPGRLEFLQRDATEPIDGSYELVLGRAILHHLDYRVVLTRLFETNLAPGGTMVFMEPLGGNPLIRLFHWIAPSAHTADERSFLRDDLRWLEASFGRTEIVPFNLLSLPCGLLSSLLFRRPDNVLMRLADRFDRWLARRAPGLAPQFRQAIVVIRSPRT
jgi:SAM-dependent methyltransferase